MKVKEIARTANVAWSPADMQDIHIACGTVAQQLDATFSTSAKLEIFSLNLAEAGLAVPLAGSVESPLRFHKLAWSAHGQEGVNACGIIAGGSDNGIITFWAADKILSSAEGAQVLQTTQHTGPVRTLDFNSFQANLLASGAGDSEIFIWDLNSPTNPMSPGNKLHPLEDISGVAWNRQVQHILASTSPSGRSVVWDLRKNEPIIQVADPNSRVHCNAIAWHPDVATQMVTASGDDRSPVVQLWDLRFATSPMRTLERHKKGILSLAWCSQDSELLLSAAKDNLVLCWNPNSDVAGGEVVYELPATSQWIFECHWCPRNPTMISTASFDGHVTMYSLLGGGTSAQESPVAQPVQHSDDPFANITARPQQQPVETTPLKRPPKWFRRPCGARFAFGGKLVSFGYDKTSQTRSVHVSQVVTEKVFLNRSSTLEAALKQEEYSNFCSEKAAVSGSASELSIWNFLKVTFEPDARRQYLCLLGYDTEQLEEKLSQFRSGAVATGPIDPSDLSHRLSSLTHDEGEGEGEEESADLFGASEGDSEFEIISAQGLTEKPAAQNQPLSISTTDDVEGALSRALLVGNFEAAVDICISDDRMAEAMVLAIAGGSDLLQRTRKTFFQKRESQINQLMSSIVNRDWTQLVRVCNLDNWREVLAALVTYAGPDEFSSLCDLLGERLECEGEGRFRDNANLCYICSGNVDKFVTCWNRTANGSSVSAVALQDLMEKVTLLQRAVERERKTVSAASSSVVAGRYRAYADVLASQGSLDTALHYLEISGTSEDNALLHDRLYQAQGRKYSGPITKLPFQTVDVQTQHMEPGQNQIQSAIPKQTRSVTNPHSAAPTTKPGGTQYAHYNPASQSGFGTGQTGITTSSTSPLVSEQKIPTGVPSADVTTVPHNHFNQAGQPVSIFNPVLATGQTTSLTPHVPVVPRGGGGPPQIFQSSSLPRWNDPPTFSTKKKESIPLPMPITAPVVALVTAPVAQQQAPPTSMMAQQDSSSLPPSAPQTQAPSSEQVVEKPPIPHEHQHMVTAFEAILTNCKSTANTTAMKRKTEDISKKLSTLCDLLRQSRISPEVLMGLHYIAQEASSVNYSAGLVRYTQMVSSGNFSEISSFMPGIKALLQMAMQLQRVQS